VPRPYAGVFIQQSTSMSSYPVHRSLPPTRRSSSDGSLVPGEAWDKPLNPHANLSLLRATRIASKGLRVTAEGPHMGPWKKTAQTGQDRTNGVQQLPRLPYY
jgi:hypothetical protein